MNFGLRWVRRQQRPLTRGVLALFCAAWLQTAVAPCVMAHAAERGSPPEDAAVYSQHGAHAAHGGHDHAAVTEGQGAAGTLHDCLYCPPSAPDSSPCDDRGGCAYPHDPQVDARALGAIFAAPPVAFVLPCPGANVLADRADPDVPAVVPRVSLSVSYCRFIE